MTEAIDTIRNTCSRRSQEERAEKTPEQRLLKAERRANEDLPCARASTRTCVAGAHICPRILGIGTFVRMWCTVRITLKSNGGTVMTGKHAMGAALELHEPGILHHLRLSSGRSVCRQDAIGVAVQNERRYSVAR